MPRESHKSIEALRRVDHRARLLFFVRSGSQSLSSCIRGFELERGKSIGHDFYWAMEHANTFSIGSGILGGSGAARGSSFSIPVSSISVPSVPLEEVAIGEGSAISVGLWAYGENWLGGRRDLV